MPDIDPQRYPAEVFWSDEDEGFIAIAPDLPGCSAWGTTEAEALSELRTAILAWQGASKAAGNPIPLPSQRTGENQYSGRFVLRVPRSLHRDLAVRAKEDNVSLNQFLVFLITKAMHVQSVGPSPYLSIFREANVPPPEAGLIAFTQTQTACASAMVYVTDTVYRRAPVSYMQGSKDLPILLTEVQDSAHWVHGDKSIPMVTKIPVGRP